MELEALAEAIDRLVTTDPARCADGESIVALEQLSSRLDAFRAEAMAAFDASCDWANDGAKSSAAWLATRCRLPKARTGRQARRGRSLRHLPACREAFLAGEISADHIDAIAGVENDRTRDALLRDEADLVGHARWLSYPSF